LTKTLFWLANAVIIVIQTEMHYVKKSPSCALLIIIMVVGFALAGTTQVSAEAPGVIVVISSDTTWTKADSPHTLTGPVFVSNGATLTIEAGATVNLNSYYLLVSGTLRVLGRSSEQVYIDNGEKIEFTAYSSAWSESGSGCILEHADIRSTVSLKTASPKINNCAIYHIVLEGNSSPVISNNEIDAITLGENNIVVGNPTISDNIIGRIGSNTEVHIASPVKSGSPTISHNTIIGHYPSGSIHLATNSPIISDNVVVDGGISVVASSPVITNNIVNGTVEVKGCEASVVISNNTITPPSRVIESSVWIIPSYTVWYLGVSIDGNNKFVDVLISNNTILGCLSGIKLANLAGSVTIENNVICDSIDDGIGVATDISLTIVGNFIHNNTDNGIKDYWGKANMVIRNNTITNNSHGITDPGPALIERNLIADNNVGLELASQATVQNNTITDNDVAIRLASCPSAKINYNNIENYGENSIYLVNTSGNVDATNNWWGTTDPQAINLTIHDYKYDFGLGKVNFTPFLTEPNTEATANPIPEFPPWIVLPLFLVATFAVIVVRKRLVG
jgi:hypothetical protein